jgi:hypothetical protein
MATPLGIRKLLRRAFNRFRFEVGQYLLRGATSAASGAWLMPAEWASSV